MAHRVCPWWMGYVLVNPLRRLLQHPEKILSPYVRKGMTVMDIGCGMGYFSLDMAKLVGSKGTVVCADLQEKMIASLEKRAKKKGVDGNLETVICPCDRLGLEKYNQSVDFILAFYLVHEVPDQKLFFKEVYDCLKKDGKILVAEPEGHISENEFEKTVTAMAQSGFKNVGAPKIFKSRTALLEKN